MSKENKIRWFIGIAGLTLSLFAILPYFQHTYVGYFCLTMWFFMILHIALPIVTFVFTYWMKNIKEKSCETKGVGI